MFSQLPCRLIEESWAAWLLSRETAKQQSHAKADANLGEKASDRADRKEGNMAVCFYDLDAASCTKPTRKEVRTDLCFF